MIQSFLLAWKNAFVFKGKTSRKDFWFFQLASFILYLILKIAQNLFDNFAYSILFMDSLGTIFAVLSHTIAIVSFLYIFGNFIVGLSISIRRLNDISKKWVWIFI